MPDRDVGSEVSRAVAANLRTLRAQRNWSLDRLAQRSGVSKGVLVALEAERGNPSLTTLCRLADAFAVSLTDLVESSRAPALRQASIAEATTLWRGPSGGSGQLILSTDPPHPVELWWWQIEPGEARQSEAHATGTQEALLVIDGEISVETEGGSATAPAGTAVTWPADIAHTYRNTGDRTAKLVLIVTVPR